MTISIFLNGQNCQQVIYDKEDEFEKFIVDNADTIFGTNSIYVDMKHKIENSSLGGTIPDGVLIDLSDLESSEFYLVEVELQKHDFRSHIYPQIDKFFDFFSNIIERNKLTEKIYSMFRQDETLQYKLKNIIGTREIYRFLKETLENSQNVMLIIDGAKPEIENTMKNRIETWGRWVNVQIVNHFRNENHNIITTEPPFQNLKFGDAATLIDIEKSDSTLFTENFHLEEQNENIKNIYNKIKQSFLKIKDSIKFNPTKSYIGVGIKKQFAYIQFYKKKVRIIIYLSENEAKKVVHLQNHIIRSHSESNQRYWGGGNNPNCSVEIYNTEHFDEIESLLQKVVANNNEES